MELNKNIDPAEELQLQENLIKHIEYINNLEPNELYDRLVKVYESTDVILEGYNLVTNVNEGHGITFAGIIRLRVALEETLTWLDNNLCDDEDSLEEIEETDDELLCLLTKK
jgi:hypothetical protein